MLLHIERSQIKYLVHVKIRGDPGVDLGNAEEMSFTWLGKALVCTRRAGEGVQAKEGLGTSA